LKTADFANETETFFEEDCRQDGSDDDAESAERGNENSIDLREGSSQHFSRMRAKS
jgi:hypothetical protein